MPERNRILIADDSEENRFLYSTILQMNFPQFVLEEFSDGKSLEKRLAEEADSIKLVLTDNSMPGITGSEIIEKYAKKPDFHKLNLFFIMAEKIK